MQVLESYFFHAGINIRKYLPSLEQTTENHPLEKVEDFFLMHSNFSFFVKIYQLIGTAVSLAGYRFMSDLSSRENFVY